MDKDIERLLKEFDTKYPGIRDRMTGLTSGWKLIRDDNRVLTTKGKHKGKYVDRRTGNLWDEKSLKTQFSKDWKTTSRATAPLGSINRSKLNLEGHDLIHKSGPLAAIRRGLSDETLEGQNVYDWQQGERRKEIVAENERLRKSLSINKKKKEVGTLDSNKEFYDENLSVENLTQEQFNQESTKLRKKKQDDKPIQKKQDDKPIPNSNKIVSDTYTGFPVLPGQNLALANIKETEPKPLAPDAAMLQRVVGIDITSAKGQKAWASLQRSGQVFDTTKKFGDKGGWWVNDTRGIPRFVKHGK